MPCGILAELSISIAHIGLATVLSSRLLIQTAPLARCYSCGVVNQLDSPHSLSCQILVNGTRHQLRQYELLWFPQHAYGASLFTTYRLILSSRSQRSCCWPNVLWSNWERNGHWSTYVLVSGSSFASLAAVLVYVQLPFSLVVAKSFRG